MIEVNVKRAVDSLRKEFASLNDEEIKKGVSRAINRSLTKGRTETSKSIRKVYTIKARDIKKRMHIERATRVYPTGSISADTKRLPLSLFKPSERRAGVSVRITKQRQVITSAFLAKTSNNFQGVFMRGRYTGRGTFQKNPERLPITSLVTLSLRRAMANNRVNKRVASFLGRYFPERLRHELSYIASKK